MEVVESIPAHIDDQGASNAADRILRLSEAVGLVVDQVVDPLVHPALARRLLSPLIPDVSASAELLTQAADGIRSSFQAELTHMVQKKGIVDQLAHLDSILGDWESKTSQLMDTDPSDVNVSFGPDPYTNELEKQRLHLLVLERKVEEYKEKITAQRETIANLVTTITEKREEVDGRLEQTTRAGSELWNSETKKWSDSQMRK